MLAAGRPGLSPVAQLRRDYQAPGLSGTTAEMGNCARVRVGDSGIDVVLGSQRHQGFDTELFTRLGCDLKARKIVVVKSTNHFYASFSKIAKHVIYASAPGASSMDYSNFRYGRVRHPRWPLPAPAAD